MAEPSTSIEDFERLVGTAVDLDSLRGIPPEKARNAMLAMLTQAGMICEGCHRLITVGCHFYRFEVRPVEQGKVIASYRRIAACLHDDCDFADKAREGAHAMEMREFAWPDPTLGLLARDPSFDPEAADDPQVGAQ